MGLEGREAATDGARRLGSMQREGHRALLAARANPELLPELAAGAWFDSGWRRRWLRQLALVVPLLVPLLPRRVQDDVAFWSGVRATATEGEWRRLAGSSYVVLCYHRTAGRALPGEERMDVKPEAVRSQLRLLRRLGWRTLTPEQLLDFHLDPEGVLPRRRYVVTADDGFAEAVDEMTGHGKQRPQLFAVTGSVGGRATWLCDAPLASWQSLERARAAGAVVGSHARRHLPLDTLEDVVIEEELSGSLADLRGRLPVPVPVLAYPHGRHDQRVRQHAREAGYALAYTTAQGRNGAGTDRWSLRRVEPKMWDSRLSFAWKVITGESPPGRWERRLVRRWERRRASGAGSVRPAGRD
jgi:peptidoglycan/xylan/chitin deacetylase (PgdA/CDA1 family)